MPVVGQIQPNYLQPHAASIVNDNTEFTDTAAPIVDNSLKSFYVITSGRGRDNVFLTHENEFDWLKEYGTPNLDLYGQAGYQAVASLHTNYCKVKTMRLMPLDAKYSNALVAIKHKTVDVKGEPTDPEDPETAPVVGKKLQVKFVSSYQDDATDTATLLTALEALRTDTPDKDGWETVPLMTTWSLGRGVYGDEYRLRATQSKQLDRENDYKNVKFDVLGTSDGLKSLEFFEGAINPEAIENKRSIYAEDILNDTIEGSKHLNVFIDPTTQKIMLDLYLSTFEEDKKPEIDVKEFDIFGFKNKLGISLPNVEIISDDTSVALDGVQGIILSGGSDGSLDPKIDATTRQESIDELLVKAFKGEINKSILSRRRVPADFILDANYSAEPKKALSDLIVKRNDCLGYLDAGIISTTTEAINWAEENENLSPWQISKNCQHFKIRDPFTYKIIPMTVSYYLAKALPEHYMLKGKFIPFAGPNVRLDGIIRDSLLPVVDADDKDIKEELYTKRVNYFETISETVYQRGCQGTAQLKWSDLSEEHNVAELLDIKRTIENYAADRIYDFAEVEDRNRFTEDGKRLFSNRIGTRVRTLDIYFDATPWEEERSILHCYIAIIFKSIAKRITVEIDINKRV